MTTTLGGDLWAIVYGASDQAAVVNSATSTITAGSQSGTISNFSCTGENRLLLVDVCHDSGNLAPVVFQVTRLGQSMTPLVGWGSWQATQYIQRFYLINPVEGAGTVTVDYGTGNSATGVSVIAAIACANVDQSSPFSTDLPRFGATQSASPSGTIQAASGMLVIDGWTSQNLTAGAVPGTNQTQIQDVEQTGGGRTVCYFSSWERAAGGGTTMSWTSVDPSTAWKAGYATGIRGVRAALVALPHLTDVSCTDTINSLGSASLTTQYTAEINTLATIGREISIFHEGEGEVWGGEIVERNASIDVDEGSTMSFTCVSLAKELQENPTYMGIVTWPSDFTAQAALNEVLRFHELGAPAVWTNKLTGGGFVNVTQRWDNMTIWQALQQLAETENAFFRETHNLRQIEMSRSLADTGMVLINSETPNVSTASSVATVITLRPDATGTYEEWNESQAGADWQHVDEAVADDDTTYIQNAQLTNPNAIDSFNLPTPSDLSSISQVRVYFRGRRIAAEVVTTAAFLRTNGFNVTGIQQTLTASFANYSQTWTLNPVTNVAWTLADITALEIGVRSGSFANDASRVTQIWVEVTGTIGGGIGILEGGFTIKEDGQHIANRVSAVGVDADEIVLNLGQSNRSSPYVIKNALRNRPTWTNVTQFSVFENNGLKQLGTLPAVGVNRNIVTFGVTGYPYAGGVNTSWLDVGGHELPNIEWATTPTQEFTIRGWIHWQVPSGNVNISLKPPPGWGDPSGNTTFICIPVQDGAGYVARFLQNGIGTTAGTSIGATEAPGCLAIACLVTENNHSVITDAPWQQRLYTFQPNQNILVSAMWIQQPEDGFLWTLDSSDDWAVFMYLVGPRNNYYLEDLASIDQYGRRAEFKSENASKFSSAIGSAAQQAANTLYDREVHHLEAHKDPQVVYESVKCMLPKAPRDWLVGDGIRLIYRENEPSISIDQLLYVLERTQTYDDAGARHWTLKLSSEPAFPKSDVDILNEQLQRILALEGLE